MNLADHIVRAVANTPLDFNALHAAMNKISGHDWTEEFLAWQVEQLILINKIVRKGDKFSAVSEPTPPPLVRPERGQRRGRAA